MTERNPGVDPHENRRQVLYWRLLARLFDHEEQASLESASLAVVEDIGLPTALLNPQVSVDSIVQRHPELAAEFDGLMALGPDVGGTRDRAAEVRRAALMSKVLLNVFAPSSGAVTAGQLARWQSDAGWLERAAGCGPGELRGGRVGGGAATGAAGEAGAGPGGGAAGTGVSPVGTGGSGTTPDLSQLIPAIGPELNAIEAEYLTKPGPIPSTRLPPSTFTVFSAAVSTRASASIPMAIMRTRLAPTTLSMSTT